MTNRLQPLVLQMFDGFGLWMEMGRDAICDILAGLVLTMLAILGVQHLAMTGRCLIAQ